MADKKSPKTASGTHTVNKSSVTGRFVSDKQVQKNPRETYKQTVDNQKKGK